MELQHLRTLLAVAEAQSLTRAAETLHLTQPAVSAQVKALEVELGLPLFHRTGRGMKLTDAGEQLLAQAKDLLTRADGIHRRAAELRGDVAGVVQLGVMDCGLDLRLARIVGKTRLHHPQLRVEVHSSNTTQNIHGVLDQSLDVAFAEGEWNEPRLCFRQLGTSRVGIIGPAKWRRPLSEGGWAQLSEVPWVFQSEGCSYCRLMRRLCEEHHVDIQPEIRADAFGAVKDLVVQGMAMSVSDLDEVRPWLEDGSIFAWNDLTFEMPVSAISLRQREDEPMIQAVLTAILQAHQQPEQADTTDDAVEQMEAS